VNSRDRIKTALRFERPDRLPVHESPWEQTAAAWYDEGIPAGVSLADYFDFDIEMMYLDPSPRFEMKVLGREGGNITYEDRFGYTITKPEGISATMHFHSHVTTDRAAWERIKPRFRLAAGDSARIDDKMYFGHFDPYPSWDEAVEKYRTIYGRNRYLLFMFYGPWEATWRHRGMENLLMDVAVDPDWVRDMAQTYQSLVLDILQHCVALGIKPDGVLSADDLGSSHAPLMSPKMWADVFKPQVARLGDFCRNHGVDFWMHSDGAIEPLIDEIVETGVQVLNPLEAKAGMDVVELRRRYGRRLAFYGNIDVRKMSGPQDELLTELRRKIPLARQGGYIMHSDHSCPPDVSLARYQWLLDHAREIFDGDR
jgi:uroporphyrinogen decarboxylase